ncbi:Precursor of CEP3 [Linum grandiflorum]
MGINRQIVICVVIVLLVLSHNDDISCVQGRHLRRPGRNTNHHRRSTKVVSTTVVFDDKKVTKMDYNVDDFRPTAPGHSPGVGHSINN